MIWAITQAGNEADAADWSSLDLDLPAGNLLQKWDLKCQICAEAITAKGLRKTWNKNMQRGGSWFDRRLINFALLGLRDYKSGSVNSAILSMIRGTGMLFLVMPSRKLP